MDHLFKTSVFRTPCCMDEFYQEEIESVTGNSCYRNTTDVSLLFNQQRLDRMTLENFSNYLDKLAAAPASPLTSIRQKMSDSQLLQFVKSRYIQSKSELMAYTSYLMAQSDEIRQALESQSSASDDTSAPNDTSSE